jgi:SagB-type dehydrogenase family enzyme
MTPAADFRYRRSPYLLLEWKGDDLVVTQCDSLRCFRADEAILRMLGRLTDWTSPEELADAAGTVPNGQLDHMMELGLVERRSWPLGEQEECRTYWNPIDLAVHRRQNQGSPPPSLGDCDDAPPPAFKERPGGPVTSLPPAEPLAAPLGDVLARRRSVRMYDSRPLRLSEVSSLLYHAARVKEVFYDPALGEHALRPFAAGGARSELEIYLMANSVDGLEPGVHHYDGRAHELVQLRHHDGDQDRINRWILEAIGEPDGPPPQMALLVTAVFARIMWKYRSIGLHLIYQNTGCLYQALYLVATTLGLAPCAVGAHPEVENARWLGLDPLVESQVGCFLVGARPRSWS